MDKVKKAAGIEEEELDDAEPEVEEEEDENGEAKVPKENILLAGRLYREDKWTLLPQTTIE